MVSFLFFSLAILLLFCPASSFSLHSLSRHTNTNLATRSSSSSSLHVHGESSEIIEEISEEIEQRNLRFGGVGRLYTTPPDDAASDSNPDAYLTVVERLSRATVIVVGLGGVGSWAAEALCRSGVGNLVLIDLDDICISNTNRQLHALSSTVGKMKIEEMKRRLLDINPQCHVTLIHDFVGPDNVQDILLGVSSVSGVSACLDAIDGARGKTSLIAACASLKIPIVTCGGSAGRTDPTKFVYDDLTRVQNDKLLAACRKDLRKHYGFEAGLSFRELQQTKAPRKWRIQAVYSMETPKIVPQGTHGSSMRRCDGALGTACFVTGTAGFVAAGLIVDMIANDKLKAPNCLRRR